MKSIKNLAKDILVKKTGWMTRRSLRSQICRFFGVSTYKLKLGVETQGWGLQVNVTLKMALHSSA